MADLSIRALLDPIFPPAVGGRAAGTYGHAMDMQQYLADVSLKAMSQMHRVIVRLSGGQLLGSAFGMPVVELHTTGRNSGLPRSTMLTAPVIDGDRVVLVASKGGDDRDPDWFRNAMAHPEVELTIAGRRRPMLARRASAAEKSELWPRVVAAYRGYGSYQRRTSRDIPLVILESR
jgi:deazaflavin-dependent oxidoreductase (nitroreductase family)